MDRFHPSAYPITKTGVTVTTEDASLSALLTKALALCEENKSVFGGIPVLREGGKYNGVWLETQPMGGEMFAAHDAVTALGNHLIFMKYQRRDGKLPGMISCSYPWRGVTPHHDWMQGDFFSRSALRMSYLIGHDRGYLTLLSETLREFDSYLWANRDTDGDGCLESFCVWDTGDDNNTRLLSHGISAHEHGCVQSEEAPTDAGDLPFESAEYMAYSYAQRSVLAEISDLLGTEEGDLWRERAEAVRRRFIEYLWDADRAAAYDRDKHNERMYVLSLANIKCMYQGIFTDEMADAFIERHLMNSEEFFTPLPLPNIAANDSCFFLDDARNNFTPEMRERIRPLCAKDMADNSWGGPVQGLCHQRVIDALLNYRHHAELTVIARRWLSNAVRVGAFPQQYDPFTGDCCPGMDGYGPAILATLEYTVHLLGIDYASGHFTLSNGSEEADSSYTQHIFGSDYTLIRHGGTATLKKDGEEILSFRGGVRIITDEALRIEEIRGMEPTPQDVTLTVGGITCTATVLPNEGYILEGGRLVLREQVAFSAPHP